MDQFIKSKGYMWVMAEDIIKVVGQGYTMIGMEHRNTHTTDTFRRYSAAARGPLKASKHECSPISTVFRKTPRGSGTQCPRGNRSKVLRGGSHNNSRTVIGNRGSIKTR